MIPHISRGGGGGGGVGGGGVGGATTINQSGGLVGNKIAITSTKIQPIKQQQ